MNPPRVRRGSRSDRDSRKPSRIIGSVTRAAAIGSFQAVGANRTPSNDTRMVAGRLMEKTIDASRSACDLLRVPMERRSAPVRKMIVKAMREGGRREESSRKLRIVGMRRLYVPVPQPTVLSFASARLRNSVR